jgi:dGTPase
MDWSKILSPERLRPTRSASDKSRDRRNAFESDFGRINFSPAIRRMHDKTQVIPLITNDNIHTRLTHSMEVQSVAYSMGVDICARKEFRRRLGEREAQLLRIIPTILSSTALAHDIGNPPFGHYGEEVLSKFFIEYFSEKKLELNEFQKLDFTKFDGNAQGFRVLTKTQVLQDQFGLNLTVGTLASFLKYPNLSNELEPNHEYRKKIGAFQSEQEHLIEIRSKTGLVNIRHPLAFLMEAADTICYSIMDIEDGYNSHYYRFERVESYLREKGGSEVKKFLDNFDRYVQIRLNKELNYEMSLMVNFRVSVIRHLVAYACKQFINNIQSIEDGDYQTDLVKNSPLAEALKSFCKDELFTRRDVCSLELTGESVLKGLLRHFIDDFIECKTDDCEQFRKADKLYRMVSESLRAIAKIEYPKKKWFDLPDYAKLRMIVDYVSGMTDCFAVDVFQRLKGIKIG